MAAESVTPGRLVLSRYVSVPDEAGGTVFTTSFGQAVNRSGAAESPIGTTRPTTKGHHRQ